MKTNSATEKAQYRAAICYEVIRLHMERTGKIPDFSNDEKWSFTPKTMSEFVRFTDETGEDIRFITEYQISLDGELMLLNEKKQTVNWAACDCTLLDTIVTTLAKISEKKRTPTTTYACLLSELTGWAPEDRFVTSRKEIQKLSDHFKMEQMSIMDLRNLRDMTVLFYSREEKVRMQPMMSLTAVIDMQIAKRGGNP